MRQLFRQFVRFAGVGCLTAIGHYGLLIALVQIFAVEEVVASSAGALLGAVINYTLNYRYTFRSRKRHRDSVGKFAAVALVGLGLNALFMWIGVHLLAWHYLPAQVVTTCLVLIWSFLGHRFWTFDTPHPAHHS